MTEELQELAIIIKWSGQEFQLTDITNEDTVAVLRHEVFKLTNVRPERQKLLNLKLKGKPAADDVKLSELELKNNCKIMMVGSTEEDIKIACQRPDDVGEVVDDLEDEEKDLSIADSPIYLAKIRKRIKNYQVNVLNPPREGKRLLVLDIDYTLFDHRSTAETGVELMRPYLHEFLESAYEHYNIVIWSATGMKWIEEKMKLLGVSTSSKYKIWFYLDADALISVHLPHRGVVDVKPLGVIWGKFPEYSAKNSIVIDDIRRNFLMNRKSGLRIKSFRNAHVNRHTDRELVRLSKYLRDIAENCDDFTKLNHKKWEQYNP